MGELSLLGKPFRQLSACALVDCLVIVLNLTAFNLVVKDRLQREQQEMGNFIYNTMPGFKHFFTLSKIGSIAYLIFKQHTYSREETIVKEKEWNQKNRQAE